MSEQGAYDRGVAAGEIAARLAGHDQHFAAINGSLAELAVEMRGLRLAVQHLADQAEADATIRVTTARALKDADEARRVSEQWAWWPKQKLIAVLGAAAALAAIVGLIIALST